MHPFSQTHCRTCSLFHPAADHSPQPAGSRLIGVRVNRSLV